MTITQAMLDGLWDYSDPAGSERRLRAAADEQTDAACRAELGTQIARALGLQQRFGEADALLDAVADESHAAEPVAVRVALERGRLRNSAGDAAAAVPLFLAAAARAASAGLDFLHVDALHMLAIADPGHAREWTAAALTVLDGTVDARTQRWRVSLHNNVGWALFDAGDREGAIAAFEQAREAAGRWGTPQQVRWADEALTEVRAAPPP